ncbi:MAG: Eco29kI family restriction endonuclease, partial [Syntrophobacteraceae bacterium]
YMILDGDESGIIGPVEASLIRKFQPLWNTIIDGFGNHTPGEGRFNQAKSGWDVLHPGRAWAARCMGKPRDYDDMVKRIGAYAKLRRKS